MDLEQRVERLERENRRWKVAAGLVGGVVAAVALVGAALPQDRLTVRELRVLDAEGRPRITPHADGTDGAPVLELRQAGDYGGLMLTSGSLSISGDDGNHRIFVGPEDGQHRLMVLNEEGNVTWKRPR